MLSLPPKPDGSIIEDLQDFDGITLRWRGRESVLARIGGAGFLGFWLCGWAVGEVFAAWAIINGHDMPWFARIFIIGWLGAWTVGGLAAMSAFLRMIRGPGYESVTLGNGFLRYQSPGMSLTSRDGPWQGRRPKTPFALLRRARPTEWTSTEIGPVVLDWAGDRQRLRFDVGAERVEIGQGLTETDREWLTEVLRRWQGKR